MGPFAVVSLVIASILTKTVNPEVDLDAYVGLSFTLTLISG